MPTALLEGHQLRLTRRFVRLRWLAIVLLTALTLPGAGLVHLSWFDSSRPYPTGIALGAVVLLLGAVPSAWLWRDLRAKRALCRDFVEYHSKIESRSELVQNGIPSERISYRYQFPAIAQSRLVKGPRHISFAIKNGTPLHGDADGETLVVLVSPKLPGVALIPRADFYPLKFAPEDEAAIRHRLVVDRIPGSFGRGLKNLDSISRGLRLLLGAQAQGRLPARRSEQWSFDGDYDVSDPVISVQRLARTVARAFGFEPNTIVVAFRSDLAAAAQVEYGPDGFLIDIQQQFSEQPREIIAILAHEVAHIFLGEHGIAPDNRFDNEVLTDLAAVLWGFGETMISTYKSEFNVSESGRWGRAVTDLGYLTPDECAYALSKVEDVRGIRKRAAPDAQRAYQVGQRRARAEAESPPLQAAPLWRRLAYRVRRGLVKRNPASRWTKAEHYRFENHKVRFNCPRCTQPMRLPTDKKGDATCPNCRVKLPFLS